MTLPNPPQVFYDPHSRRWTLFKRTIQALSAFLSFIFGALVVSVLVNPVLPRLGISPIRALPQPRHLALPQSRTGPTVKNRHYLQTKLKLTKYLSKQHSASASLQEPLNTTSGGLSAFFVNWDDNSFSSLRQNLTRIDRLIPEWLHLDQSDGSIRVDDSRRQEQVLSFLSQHRPNLPILPLINNFDSSRMQWESNKLTAMLSNSEYRARTIAQLLDYVRRNHFAGIHIDFESLPGRSQPALELFMRELYARFHPLNLEVSQSVPLHDPAFNYMALARGNDYLVLMAYDENSADNEAGPVASHRFFYQNLRRRFRQLAPDKVVVAIGCFGYDWKREKPVARELSFQEAMKTAEESEGIIRLDSETLNPTYDYYDDNDVFHRVWFLDAVTAFNQLAVIQRYAPKGIGLWRLGSEDPSIWTLLDRRRHLNRQTAETLCELHYGYDLDYEGKGEVLRVTATPHDGRREITFDDRADLIVSERLLSYASPYVITRWGATDDKKIALTFDDGPDNKYTPAILDVLRSKRAAATFFIIGLNADLNPKILSRLVAEGHEIGNHTFTHPNIALIGREQLSLEINATERLLESRLGRHSLLFRPPYAEDIEPETPEQVVPLLLTSERGYYTIGMQIDPGDWRSPGAEEIVKAVLEGAANREGNVVLLHDGGGDRSQTLDALPAIIDGLRKLGFELVTISRLLGLNQDAVIPPISRSERLEARIDEAGFQLINLVGSTLRVLFLAGIVLGLLRLILVGIMATVQYWRYRKKSYRENFTPEVSVVIPAYNEAKVICRTLQSLVKSDYPHMEILMVDDGSSDGTYETVWKEFGNSPQLRIFRKTNGGKSSALNYGLHRSTGDILVTLDADTIFRADAIKKLVRHFSDPRVGAVAGNAKVGNRVNVLTQWQALEYITSQNLDRRAFEVLNCISVVPGAIGAWRRNLVEQSGGFAGDTLAEDADLTLAILRKGFIIEYEEAAIALTEAPDAIRPFLKQRFRWMYGTLQAIWKHRDTLLKIRYGALGILALPNMLIFQVLFPLISPVMDLIMVWSFMAVTWQWHYHPLDFSNDGFKRVLFYFTLFLAVDFLFAFIAFLLERTEDFRLLTWLFFQRFLYRQLMYYVAIRSTITAIRGTVVGWGKLERKATVQ